MVVCFNIYIIYFIILFIYNILFNLIKYLGFKRNWEKGFLSADCGFSGKDNIGYLQLYQPDIQGSSDVRYFNCFYLQNL